MNSTKKPKQVTLEWEKEIQVSYKSKYQCPSCRTIFQGFVRDQNVIRFRCQCGQELIVKGV